MNHGKFIWVDLSTFQLNEAKSFYQKVFNWQFHAKPKGYENALPNEFSNQSIAAIYEMPAFFQKIKMPSFWMSYIAVSDITQAIKVAKKHGGKIEIEETNPLGKVALIRDPAGAGFTIIESDIPSSLSPAPNHWIGSELWVESLSSVSDFYQALFNWNFCPHPTDPQRHLIITKNNKTISVINESHNKARGDKVYWAVYFKTQNPSQALENIRKQGGETHGKLQNSHGHHHLCYDSQGAFFFLTESTGALRIGK